MSFTARASSGTSGRWTLLALTLLGFGLRVLRLEFQPLWWDEGYSVWFATHPLSQMAALTARDIHPPLYYALLHGWTLLLGTAPVVLRLLSIFAGVLTIPTIHLVGRRLLGARPALLAALLAAISPLAVFYSQEVRMYGLVALLSAGILLAAWQVLGPMGKGSPDAVWNRSERRRLALALLPYVLLTTAALYTQYYAVFLPVGLTLFAIWQWWRERTRHGRQAPTDSASKPSNVILSGSVPSAALRDQESEESRSERPEDSSLETRRLGAWLSDPLRVTAARSSNRVLGYWFLAQAVVALLFLPWVLYAGPKLVPYVSQKVVQDADRPLGLLAYLGRHLSAFAAGHLEGPLAPYWPAVLLLLIPAAVGLVWAMRFGSKGSGTRDEGSAIANAQSPVTALQSPILMLLLVLASALLLGWLVGLRYPFFPERGERLLLLALPAFLLLVAAGLNAFIRRLPAVGYAALGLSAVVSVASLVAFYATPRYAENDYRPLIARIVEQGMPGDTVFAIYPWQAGYWRAYGDPNGPVEVLTPEAAWGAPVAAALQDALDRGRVWFPAHLSLGGILEGRVEDYLRAHAVTFVNEWYGPNTRLSAWAELPQASPVDLAPVRFSLPGAGAGMIELSGAGAPADPVPAANAVMPLSLSWTADVQPPELAASVRLTDELGHIWAQHDYEPLGGPAWRAAGGSGSCDTCGDKSALRGEQARPWKAVDRLGLLIPAGTPPGRYNLEVVLHPVGEERPLDVLGADEQVRGDAARVFDVTVDPAGRAIGPEHLPISTVRPVEMKGGLRFLGYSIDGSPSAPGELRKVNLFWRATDRPAAEYTAFVQLLDRQGRVAAGWEAPPGAAYPTQVWKPGELIRTQAEIRAPANLPDGRYLLIGGLFRNDDKTRLQTLRGGDHLDLGHMTVRGRAHDMTAPNPSHGLDARFGNLARLTGYDMAPPAEGVRPGETLPLTLYWQALGASERPYTVFVHLLNGAGNAMGYGDGEPAGGQLPTTGWLADEYIKDEHQVSVRADAQAGAYRLAVGLYDPASGERLKMPDGADQVVLELPVNVR
jgi:4-amino-4-deoxy-L-arabinose transferase-like glycosyltransferase